MWVNRGSKWGSYTKTQLEGKGPHQGLRSVEVSLEDPESTINYIQHLVVCCTDSFLWPGYINYTLVFFSSKLTFDSGGNPEKARVSGIEDGSYDRPMRGAKSKIQHAIPLTWLPTISHTWTGGWGKSVVFDVVWI